MSNELEDRLDAIFQAVRDFAQDRVAELVRHELALGTDAQIIINDALIAAMEEVGDEFAAGRLFVPEMLMAANAMKAGLEVLRPSLAGHAIGRSASSSSAASTVTCTTSERTSSR